MDQRCDFKVSNNPSQFIGRLTIVREMLLLENYCNELWKLLHWNWNDAFYYVVYGFNYISQPYIKYTLPQAHDEER